MENVQEKSPSQILNEAADLLEEEGRWNQGSYFRYKKQYGLYGPACSMCAHGAIAYCGNSEIRKKVIDLTISADPAAVSVFTPVTVSAALARGRAAEREGLTPEQHIYKHYKNVGVAHYRAVKAGLTFGFNDFPGRTQQEVVDKLREVAKYTCLP